MDSLKVREGWMIYEVVGVVGTLRDNNDNKQAV